MTMERFIDIDGINTRYYEFDNRVQPDTQNALVLIHGGQFGALVSADSWNLNFEGLSRFFHVYAFDKLGMGYTDNPKNDNEYTFEALVSHARGFLSRIGIKSCHLVGHSRGALLATWIALEKPDVVKSLVIVDSNSTAKEDSEFPSHAFYDELAKRTPAGPVTRETARMEADAQSYSTSHVTEDFVERLYTIAKLPKISEIQEKMKFQEKSIWNQSIESKRIETIRLIESEGLKAPTLVVWGANDPSAPPKLAIGLYESIRKRTEIAQLHFFNHAGHYSFREHPEDFNALISYFCRH